MGDRRVADRRAKEEGVIKIQFKSAIIYLTIAVILIVSVSANIVFFIRNRSYRDEIEYYQNSEELDDLDDDLNIEEEETNEENQEINTVED